jgi:hypothetical protein
MRTALLVAGTLCAAGVLSGLWVTRPAVVAVTGTVTSTSETPALSETVQPLPATSSRGPLTCRNGFRIVDATCRGPLVDEFVITVATHTDTFYVDVTGSEFASCTTGDTWDGTLRFCSTGSSKP